MSAELLSSCLYDGFRAEHASTAGVDLEMTQVV